MPSNFGRKANHDLQSFAKKLGVRHNFGRKVVNTIDKISNVVGRVADIASIANPELAPGAMAVKGISGQATGLAQSGVALTGKRPNMDLINQQVEQTKQYAKDLKVARDGLQRKKPSLVAEDDGVAYVS
jgi:hypothetical protein